MVSHSDITKYFSYDQATGIITNRVGRAGRGARAGCVSGRLTQNGYRSVCFKRGVYQASRLIWLYMTGVYPPRNLDIDHINGVRDDNRWENLRLATRRQNLQNKRLGTKNVSGFKGVSRVLRKKSDVWEARIVTGGKQIRLGKFGSPALAHAAYVEAAKKHFGQFARFS